MRLAGSQLQLSTPNYLLCLHYILWYIAYTFVLLHPLICLILNKKVIKFEIDLDFVLIAITSPLKDYRLCYMVNKELNFTFTRVDDLKLIPLHNEPVSLFSLFKYYWETTETEFFLIANKGTEGYLVPEMNRTDFLFMIKNYIDDNDLDDIVLKLNRIPEIVAAVKVDPKKIKSRENLLF